MRRFYHYLELRNLRSDTALHWFQQGLALIRNLCDFEEYLEENGHPRSKSLNKTIASSLLASQC